MMLGHFQKGLLIVSFRSEDKSCMDLFDNYTHLHLPLFSEKVWSG